MIPLSVPHLGGNEWKYVKQCIDTGWVSSAGSFVSQFEQMVADYAGVKYGVACVNGTAGLHLTMHMYDVTRGDHVIVPNITFIASANAASYTYADPIFIDIDPLTWQMDLELLEEFLSDQTEQKDGQTYLRKSNRPIKAIMPVHVLGNMCDMTKLVEICEKYHLIIIEDASESLGSFLKGKHSGGFGQMGVFSFNGNKIVTTGGGGVIVTDNEALARRAKHLTTQAKADPERYYHDEIGFNYRLVNVLAAIGVAQMEQLDGFLLRKKKIDAFYRDRLSNIGDIRFQEISKDVDPNCWLFTFYSNKQEEILASLKRNEIVARPFWIPMNQLPMFHQNHYIKLNDHSRDIHANCLSIPSSVNLTEEDMLKVVAAISEVF